MPDNQNEHDRRSYDAEIAELKSEVKELRTDIKELIEAWNAAKGVTSFVKWLSGIIVACVSLYALATGKKP
jgi:hypothetical protein